MLSIKEILIGSNNFSKQLEIKKLFNQTSIIIYTPDDFSLYHDPPESGSNHREIAEQKAISWSKLTNKPVISSDGGIIIPSLANEWESIHTKRNAGKNATNSERANHLVNILKDHTEQNRIAQWTESIAIAANGNLITSFNAFGPTGTITRTVTKQLPDEFWVYPIWYFKEFNKTYNDLTCAEKIQLKDHWQILKDDLKGFLDDQKINSD
jgi:inosine/xanthosine triphosphate pyrophosphatase family protein